MKSANGFTAAAALGCPLLILAATAGEPGDDAAIEGATVPGLPATPSFDDVVAGIR
jgi:hypothetical protein